jgi:hypothetical protein
MAKDPAARPSSARELVAGAAQALGVDEPSAPADVPVPGSLGASLGREASAAALASRGGDGRRPRRSPTRRRVRALSFTLPVALLFGLALVAALRWTGGDERAPRATPGPTAQRLGTTAATAPLLPPGGQASATAPTGTTRIEAQRGRRVITVAAEGLAPEPRKPVAAYAVWLANSRQDALPLGFVVPRVGSSGRFVSHRDLPAAAQRYREVLLTLEDTASRTPQGPIILRGALRLPRLRASGPAPGRGPRPAGRSPRGG